MEPIGGLVQNVPLLSDPHPLLISSSCLPSPPLCSWRNLFVLHLHSLRSDKDKCDGWPSSGRFLSPFVNETLREWLSMRRLGEIGDAGRAMVNL